jgi:hypothetical protein
MLLVNINTPLLLQLHLIVPGLPFSAIEHSDVDK